MQSHSLATRILTLSAFVFPPANALEFLPPSSNCYAISQQPPNIDPAEKLSRKTEEEGADSADEYGAVLPAANPAACKAAGGYWYKGKCWQNAENEAIDRGDIDRFVEEELVKIRKARMMIGDNLRQIEFVYPETQDDEVQLIVGFNEMQDFLLIECTRQQFEGSKPFRCEAAYLRGNLLEAESEDDIEFVAAGELKNHPNDNFNINANGTLTQASGKKIDVRCQITEAMVGAGNSTLEVRDDQAFLSGTLGTVTYPQVTDLIRQHPEIRTITLTNVDGSVNDAVNMHTGRLIREAGLNTQILRDSEIASGGVDLFCAGVKRFAARGAKIGVHSWGGDGHTAADIPVDHPDHRFQVAYFKQVLGQTHGPKFYFYTLTAAPFDDIHWMSVREINHWKIVTDWTHDSALPKTSQQPQAYTIPAELTGEARMLMAMLDQNSDLKLQDTELEGDAKEILEDVDANQDGTITVDELSSMSNVPITDVHAKLSAIDTRQNPERIVDLPVGIHIGLNRHFRKYTNVLAPNGTPIHLLAMDGWSDTRLLRVRKVLEHFLQDVPDRQWGDKSMLANAMANNHAALVLLNSSDDMERVFPDIEGTDLHLQDLRANESPFEGEDDYMQHKTRDAAFEEIFHLIHGSGVIFAMREFDREIRNLATQAARNDIWNYDEPNMPGSHFEYIICVYDNYIDLWKTAPTMMEGNRIGRQPEDQSFNGEYKADQRSNIMAADPQGLSMIEKFNSKHITYTAELPVEFKGTFSMSATSGHRYSEKAKHLLNATLRGNHPSNLTGNQLNNRLVGNTADNVLTGNGGDDSLFGGPGNDVAVFRGPKSQYTIRRIGGLTEVHDSMVNRDGYDMLQGIETIQFADQRIDLM